MDEFTAQTGREQVRASVRVRASAYSACIAAAATGTPQRGSVHSVFAAAANILFPGDFVLSLNASAAPRMPNGLHLSVPAGAFPFSALRPGMPALLGASRLHIEALACSLDLSTCPQWNPHIAHPSTLNLHTLKENHARLHRIWEKHATSPGLPGDMGWQDIPELARALCGRGVGLTPAGDDMLAGWMAVGWLLYGPEPAFLTACEQIMAVALRQTHLLSRCWLGYAAQGNVALPIVRLLEALARERGLENVESTENDAQLEPTAQAVLALGATSGYDVISGILLGLEQFFLKR